MRIPRLAYAALLVTVFFWGTAFPAIRAALHAFQPGHLVLFRFAVASLVLVVVACVRGLRRPALRDLPRIGLVAAAMFLYPISLTYGQVTVPAAAASLLIGTTPVLMALLARLLLGERLAVRGWIGIVVSFVGVSLIAIGHGGMRGVDARVAIVLFSAIVLAFQYVVSKPLLSRYTALELTAYTVWGGTLLDAVFARGLFAAIAHAPLVATLAIVYLGAFCTTVAVIAWSYALARVTASTAASFLYLVPPVSALVAWGWLGEIPGPLTLVGGAVAIGGVMWMKRAAPRPFAPRERGAGARRADEGRRRAEMKAA